MTERPILFSAEMVRAILAGRKTQTRRVIKPQPQGHYWETLPGYQLKHTEAVMANGKVAVMFRHTIPQNPSPSFENAWITCPYGQPGDALWVREGFAVQPLLWADNRGPQPIHYTADLVVGFAGKPDTRQIEDYRSKPSIHMPRWASRITLEVKSVRVERLQDISRQDCEAEGCAGGHGSIPGYNYSATPREHFFHLWNRINGPGAWEANPWAWVISFERVKP